MALALEQPRRRRWFGRNRGQAAAPPAGAAARVHPLGAGAVGFWTVLLAAWAGISVFVGPLFGYHPTSRASWDWTMPNWLLHAVPGAVGVFAGLMMLGMMGARGVGRRSGISLASLLAMAAGAWLVIGPVSYRLFESTNGYAQPATAWENFWHQIGANLGPGVLLLILGGMALKAGIAVPRIVYEPVEGMAPAGTAVADRPVTDRPVADRTAGEGTTQMPATGTASTGTAPAGGTHFAGSAADEPIETRRTTEQ
jgi:hypothetical protein